jgi:hypothetical protein
MGIHACLAMVLVEAVFLLNHSSMFNFVGLHMWS